MKTNHIVSFLFLLCIFFPAPSGAKKTVRIEVDATQKTGTLEPFWASQIVHPTEFILTGWGAEFVDLLTRTGAARQYIRIYNQPEKAIRIDAKGNISYDWSAFDRMAEMILLSGNKPKIVFFGMPYEIALFPESVKKRPYGGLVCISPPKDYKLWEELCADFTRHVIRKYGPEEVKQWTFRCWNEPDLAGFWYKGDLSEYMKLYDWFAKGVKEVCPDIKIGGPALSSTETFRKPEHLRMFYEHVVDGVNHATGGKGAPVDFIAVHTYGGSGAGAAPGRAYPEVDYMMEQQLMYADMRDEYEPLKNLPIHVEEWGEASGGATGVHTKPTADIRNSQYGAAFLTNWVGRHIRMQQENDRKIESFTFCSSGYERLAEADFMGYRTLHTKNGFYKPVLNGYQLLKKLDKELIQTTVTSNKNILSYATRSENRICILITNYQHEHPFNDGIAEKVSLRIKPHWGETATMTVRHYRIDEHHSNAYSAFKISGSPELIDPITIDSIKKRMDLELLEKPLQMKGKDHVSLQFFLPCNAVSLLEIELNDPSWQEAGKIAPRHAREIQSSNWSVGAEMLDRDWTVYSNWKEYLGPLGAKKARIQSGWAKTEKNKGVYDWLWLDEIIHDMTAQGVTPWISLSYGNPLYTGGGGTSLNAAVPESPEAMEAWKRYVTACVTRYRDYVEEWEVWNEPNYTVAAGNYANLFIATAEIIRDKQPGATIIAFAIGSGVDYKYVDKVMAILRERGKIHLVDQITHHRHIFIPEKNESELELRKVADKYNPDIKIRQGEGGCPSQRNEGYALNKYDWTETMQAKHISRRLLTDLGRDKESSCFTLMESRSPQEWNYKGLLKANPDSTVAYPKPAYHAFQHITSVFDDRLERIKQYRYSAEFGGENNISLYAYKDKAGNQVVTIWLNDSIPSDDNQKSFRDFTFYEGQFNQPVWVDIVSGKVYKIPGVNWSKNGTRYDFNRIPVYDSPILIADMSVLKTE